MAKSTLSISPLIMINFYIPLKEQNYYGDRAKSRVSNRHTAC